MSDETTTPPHTYNSVVTKSVSKESAFSTPGKMNATRGPRSPKTWKPAHGVRFRPTSEKGPKSPVRKRKRARDERSVTFY